MIPLCLVKMQISNRATPLSAYIPVVHRSQYRTLPRVVKQEAAGICKLMAREGGMATLRLPSGEMRMVSEECRATIGQVGNIDHENITIGKAGRSRWLNKRPHVRGVVMNPVDHPHGGGEGKSPIGRKSPVTPWGMPTLGYKTRKKNKASDKFIVKRRK